MIYTCADENRKAVLFNNPSIPLNGIDFLEVQDAVAPAQPTLQLHCLKPFTTPPTPANILITGGESITDIVATSVTLAPDPSILLIQTNHSGDFSTYTLRLVNSVTEATGNPFALTDVLQGFDPQLAEATFSFKIDCGPDFDCNPQPCTGTDPAPTPPPIDYLAKDYGSFRTLLLDRLTQLLPAWSPTSEADLGITLAELIAYRGDLLSYRQDAIATEAYLATARSRISLRRHALLVDYHVHDGANARAFVHLEVSGDPVASIAGDPNQAVTLHRAATRFYTANAGPILPGNEEAALGAGTHFFEPMQDAVLYPEHNRMSFYLWGDPRLWNDARCCLPRGATEATLHGAYPNLQPGDILIFQEIAGPQTGSPADADLRHRHAVRLTQVATRDTFGNPLADPLFLEPSGIPPTSIPVQVTQIQWSSTDALPFPLCLSSHLTDSLGNPLAMSIVLGNIVLADHGLTIEQVPLGAVPAPTLFYPPGLNGQRDPLPVRFRPTLPDSPLTQAVPLPLAGSPVTPDIVMLPGTGAQTLTDSNGSACLLIQPGNPALWPHFFGLETALNKVNPANLDLIVLYAPPGVATQPVVLEAFANLSVKPADPNFIATQINARSHFLRVPATYVPPAAPPAAVPATIAMLSNSGPITLATTSTPAIPYLTLQPANPAGWLTSLGVIAQGNQRTPEVFSLSLLYNPDDGSPGLATPITLESFPNLTLATVPTTFTNASQLISVRSFAQTPNPTLAAADLMLFDPAQAVPAISLTETSSPDQPQWTALRDLLGSAEPDRVFVVETEFDGTATLRFATPGAPGSETEGTNGMVPTPGATFTATYRIGNGTPGNLGAESLTQLSAADPRILRCTNPLPATGGADPETPEQIRRRAPQDFLSPQRSITLTDYQQIAQTNPAVNQAVASLRWTGSWYSVFLAVEPKGGGTLTPALQKSLYTQVDRFRLAGQDLELESPQYISLQITLQVTIAPDYFRANVQQALLQVLGNRVLPNGRKGLFHPDNFDFGETVYLSPLYAAARAVPGVLQVAAVDFQPQGIATNRHLTSGEIKLGSLQVARLENDPSFPNHGQLTLILQGGR